MVNCASPAYLERYGVPQTLEDLAQHRLVHYVGVLGSRSEGFVYEQGGQVRRLPMAGSVTVNSTDAYGSACLGGFGLVQVPRTGMQPHLDTGELVTGIAAVHGAGDGDFNPVCAATALAAAGAGVYGLVGRGHPFRRSDLHHFPLWELRHAAIF